MADYETRIPRVEELVIVVNKVGLWIFAQVVRDILRWSSGYDCVDVLEGMAVVVNLVITWRKLRLGQRISQSMSTDSEKGMITLVRLRCLMFDEAGRSDET